MNKYLLAGCAAAALTLCGGIANAQDFKVTLSGESKFEAYFGSQDKDANTRAVDFRNRFRFNINPEAVGLNGALTYGAYLKVKAEDSTGSATSFEANYIYLSGAFGKVYLGDETTFSDDYGSVTYPTAWISEDDGFHGFVGSSADATYNSSFAGLESWRDKTVQMGGQATRLRYDSPAIYGVTIGLGYTPQGNSNSDAWSLNRDKRSTAQDVYEIGILFDSTNKTIADKFGAAKLKFSADYQAGRDGRTSVGGFKYENPRAFDLGLQVGYAGFTVGGHYVNWGKSNLWKGDEKQTERYAYGIAGQYETGPWAVGVGYTYSQKDTSNANAVSTTGKKQTTALMAGVKYTVAKGLDVYADYGYLKTKNTEPGFDSKDNANVFVLGTVLSW